MIRDWEDGEPRQLCSCCENWLTTDEFVGHRYRVCNLCKIVKNRWNNIVMRVRYGAERRFPYESYFGVELRMTFHEFLPWASNAIRRFLILHPNEVPTINRLGKHYELGRIEVVSQKINSGIRYLNCMNKAEADLIRMQFASGWWESNRDCARSRGVSDQTIGRLLKGITYN